MKRLLLAAVLVTLAGCSRSPDTTGNEAVCTLDGKAYVTQKRVGDLSMNFRHKELDDICAPLVKAKNG